MPNVRAVFVYINNNWTNMFLRDIIYILFSLQIRHQSTGHQPPFQYNYNTPSSDRSRVAIF